MRLEFTGIPGTGEAPKAYTEGMYRVILPPLRTSGIPICQPVISSLKLKVAGRSEASNICPFNRVPTNVTETSLQKSALAPSPSSVITKRKPEGSI